MGFMGLDVVLSITAQPTQVPTIQQPRALLNSQPEHAALSFNPEFTKTPSLKAPNTTPDWVAEEAGGAGGVGEDGGV